MTDIVERLQECANWAGCHTCDGPIYAREAIAAIKGLRAEIACLEKAIDENIAWDGKQAVAEHALMVKVQELAIILESRMGQIAT